MNFSGVGGSFVSTAISKKGRGGTANAVYIPLRGVAGNAETEESESNE